MKILRLYSVCSSFGMLSLAKHGRPRAFIVYGRDEWNRVIDEHTADDSAADAHRALAITADLPAAASQPTIEMAGHAALTLEAMISPAANAGVRDGEAQDLPASRGERYAFLVCARENEDPYSAAIGYAELDGSHRLHFFHSREQCRRTINSVPALGPCQGELIRAVWMSPLPETSALPHIEIDGIAAEVFNCTYLSRESAAMPT